MERASRTGVLKAMEENVKLQRETLQKQITDPLRMCGWILSIQEVATFVNEYLDAAFAQAPTPETTDARNLARGFGSGDATGATTTLILGGNLRGACEILRIVLVIFGHPMDAVNAQFNRTIGTDDASTRGTGTHDLHRGIDRLAFSARYTRATLQADQVPIKAAEVRGAARAAAQAGDELGVVAVPGVVAIALQGFGFAGYSAYQYWSSIEWLSNVPKHTSYDLMDPAQKAVVRDALLGNLTTNEYALRDGLKSGAIQASLRANEMNEKMWAKVLIDARANAALSEAALLEVNQALAEFAPRVAIDPEQDPQTLESAQKASMEATRLRAETDANHMRYKFKDLMESVNAIGENRTLIINNIPRSSDLIIKAALVGEFGADRARAAVALATVWPQFQQRFPVLPDRDFRGIYGPGSAEPIDPLIPNPAAEQGVAGNRGARTKPGQQSGFEPPSANQGKDIPDASGSYLLPLLGLGGFVLSASQINALRSTAAAVIYGVGNEGGGGDGLSPPPMDDDPDYDPPEVQVPISDDYCITKTREEAIASPDATLDGLCAAISQLREDGGFANGPDRQVIRGGGVSPFWDAQYRPLVREGPDEWGMRLWPDSIRNAATFNDLGTDLAGLEGRFQAMSLPPSGDPTRASSAMLATKGTRCLLYCVARGLTGSRAPHDVVPPADSGMRYNFPLMGFDSEFATKFLNQRVPAVSAGEASIARLAFSNTAATTVTQPDCAHFSKHPVAPMVDPVNVARWAPVSIAPKRSINQGDTQTNYRMDPSTQNQAVAEAVVYERMVDNYKAVARTREPEKARFGLACAAAAKVAQLPSLVTVFNTGDLRGLCKPHPISDDDGDAHVFLTRPAMRCPGGGVLYPCDAGLSHRIVKQAAVRQGLPEEFEQSLTQDRAWGRANAQGARNSGLRSVMTASMRVMIGGRNGPAPPLYIARPVGEVGAEKKDTKTFMTQRATRAPAPNALPNNKELVNADALVSMLRSGLAACTKLEQLQCEEDAIKNMQAKDASAPALGPSDLDKVARGRREAVWDDALREACISGDRLYAFVRQLSGTISENVDAICQIDEGMLVRQQAQIRERRTRASEQAAREHMQLVRNVFSSVLRESGLTLGIAKEGGDIGELKVVSNTLRKQASQLADKGSASEGFFSNAVRLENLLEQGTGEMKLRDLFAQLREAGVALQEAAMQAQTQDGLSGNGPSLDFLSAPRNSLILRYKPEALAAMRQGFDIFHREMRTQHGRMHRAITAYELIEGKDEALCSAFATFAAHMLVNSRMYSSATAMYVAAWPAAANAQQLKISLQRLVRVAVEYMVHCSGPIFSANDGRDRYFGNADCAPRFLMPPRPLFYKGNEEQINFYGNR